MNVYTVTKVVCHNWEPNSNSIVFAHTDLSVCRAYVDAQPQHYMTVYDIDEFGPDGMPTNKLVIQHTHTHMKQDKDKNVREYARLLVNHSYQGMGDWLNTDGELVNQEVIDSLRINLAWMEAHKGEYQYTHTHVYSVTPKLAPYAQHPLLERQQQT